MKKQQTIGKVIKFILNIILSVLIIALILMLFNIADTKYSENKMSTVEDIVNNAVVNYYSIYGSYPDTYDELLDKSSISIDDNYYIDYKVFSSNIKPEITVIKR